MHLLKTLQGQQKGRFNLALTVSIMTAAAVIIQAALLAQILSQLILAKQFAIHLAFYLSLTMVLRALASWIKDTLSMRAAIAIRAKLRNQLTQHLANLGPARRLIDQDGSLSTTVYEQVDALDDYFARYQLQTKICVLIPLTILICVSTISWVAAAIFLGTAPLVIYFMILVGKKAAGANRKLFSQLALLSNQFVDLSRGLVQLKLLGRTKEARSRLEQSAEGYQSSIMKVLQLAFLSTATLELFSSIAIALTALLLGLGLLEQLPWAKGETFVALKGALFILILAPEFYLPLRQLGTDYHAKQKAVAAAERILAILDTELIQTQPISTDEAQLAGLVQSATPPSIKFSDVCWSMDGRALLRDINFTINSGERIWLYGESGAGKSSLLNLLLGFSANYSGTIEVDKQLLSPSSAAHWRSQLAWLPQKPEWVSGTLSQNLKLGLTGVSEPQIREALKQADALEFVEQLPMGLDTPLSELGSGLSGGQLQRLSIARAVLSQAPVWLLDEPCAHLDGESAQAIYNTLATVTKGKTTLLISHDTHPVNWADRVVKMASSQLEPVSPPPIVTQSELS
jgi:ATP-binding cassette subfamily C protein CydD